MTQPDETTMPDRPEKAHGDALEDVVDSDQAAAAESPAEDETH